MADLMKYLPYYYTDVNEINRLMEAENPEFEALAIELLQCKDNQFILSADDWKIRQWEKLLQVQPDLQTQSLEQRRMAVYIRLNEKIPYTIRTLQRLLDTMFGVDTATAIEHFDDYLLEIIVSVLPEDDVGYIVEQLRGLRQRVIPANLIMESCTEAQKMETGVYVSAAMGRGMMVTTLPEFVPEYDFTAKLHSGVAMMGSIMSTRLPPLYA